MPIHIPVEDYGASVAEAIIKVNNALDKLPLTDRAIVVLIHDYDKSLTITDATRALEVIRDLKRYYVKDAK